MYHMQQLRKDDYVRKDTGGYVLSQKGKLFSGRMSLRQGSALMQPKIVAMLVCQDVKGDYLLFRWTRQPYRGLVSFPFSKVHFGRTIVETLQEAFFYKTNLKGSFAYVGDIYIKVLGKNKETDDHMLAHIYRVTDMEGVLGGHDGLTGQPFWGRPKDIPTNEQVPGFINVLEVVGSGAQGFMREVVVDQPND